MQVHPGEMIQVVYEVVNTQGRAISAQAIPSYAPKQSTQHFTKLECFCFEEQTLKPNESREMPVVFLNYTPFPKEIKKISDKVLVDSKSDYKFVTVLPQEKTTGLKQVANFSSKAARLPLNGQAGPIMIN